MGVNNPQPYALYKHINVVCISLSILIFVFPSMAAEKSKDKVQLTLANKHVVNKLPVKVHKTPYVIETLVEGSQEQPNVIYITPWQDKEASVKIKQSQLGISLPKIGPIHPKKFKKRLIYHYQNKH